MKTHFLILFFLLTISAKTQTLGLHLNGHFSIPTGEILPQEELKGKEGGTVGFLTIFNFNNFDIQAEINYSQQKVKWESQTSLDNQKSKFDLTMKYLEIPVMIKKRFFEERLGLMLGAQNGILLENPSFEDLNINKVDVKANIYKLGFLIGADYSITDSDFLIQIRYIQGATKILNKGNFNNSVISLGVVFIIDDL